MPIAIITDKVNHHLWTLDLFITPIYENKISQGRGL